MISTTLSPLVEKLSNFLSAHPDRPVLVALDGRCGSGKTTLTEMLTERYGAKAYYEQSDNPYIGDFYNDMNRWS